MKGVIGFALVLWVSFGLFGCGSESSRVPARQLAPRTGFDISHLPAIRAVLYDHYRNWYGVPYRTGGMGRKGLDCSSFVYLTYSTQFGLELPRTTRSQAESGRKISRSELSPGDLVLFKTGWFDRHIGIYLENNQFIHVSTRRGVTLSGLDDLYWKDRFWQARRLLY